MFFFEDRTILDCFKKLKNSYLLTCVILVNFELA